MDAITHLIQSSIALITQQLESQHKGECGSWMLVAIHMSNKRTN